jgi:hypothetical protein
MSSNIIKILLFNLVSIATIYFLIISCSETKLEINIKSGDTNILSFSPNFEYKNIRFRSWQKFNVKKIEKNDTCNNFDQCCVEQNVRMQGSFVDSIDSNKSFEFTCFDEVSCLFFVEYYDPIYEFYILVISCNIILFMIIVDFYFFLSKFF